MRSFSIFNTYHYIREIPIYQGTAELKVRIKHRTVVYNKTLYTKVNIPQSKCFVLWTKKPALPSSLPTSKFVTSNLSHTLRKLLRQHSKTNAKYALVKDTELENLLDNLLPDLKEVFYLRFTKIRNNYRKQLLSQYNHRPLRGFKWEDGTLYGKKVFVLQAHFNKTSPSPTHLVSPVQGTVWLNHTMTTTMDVDDTLRGVKGLHAYWPHRNPNPHIVHYIYNKRLNISGSHLIADVAGWGDSVTGHDGFRCTHMMIRKIWLANKVLDYYCSRIPGMTKGDLITAIKSIYPDIDVITDLPPEVEEYYYGK